MQEIPTLRPSEEEFKDPIAYLSSPTVKKLGIKYGMVKMIPPAGFKPHFGIDEEHFTFKCRLQTLMELDIENRSRLLFWKQLNNLKRSRGDSKLLASAEVSIKGQSEPLYYYDIYKTVVRYFQTSATGGYPNHEQEDNSDGYRKSNNRSRSRRKRQRNGTPFADEGQGSCFPLVNPRDMMKDQKAWDAIAKQLAPSNPLELKRVFTAHILPYYRFLYNQILAKGEANNTHISRLLYRYDYPKSLLEEENSTEGSEDENEEVLPGEELDYLDSDTDVQEEEDADDDDDDDEDDKCPICSRMVSKSSSHKTCNSCESKFHNKCVDHINNSNVKPSSVKEWICNTCIIGNGYYGFKEPSSLFTLKSFKEYCSQFDEKLFDGNKPTDIQSLEKMFWKHVESMDSNPLTVRYGADIHNNKPGQTSGFPTTEYVPSSIKNEESEEYKNYLEISAHPWNLMNLPRAKGSLLSIINRKISGMTIPWIYVGSTFSTFCWHLEDQYTLSANYQHAGSQKVWYSIPERDTATFDEMMKSISPDLFERQPDLLHQLITLISPYSKRFTDSGISCYKAIQNPGEYIITFPKCYHAGFNCGFNFNEAVNFTLDLWLPYGQESINDYKLAKRTAVVNIFDLMSNVLNAYLRSPESFDASFVSTCAVELKEWFNREFKNMAKVKDIVGETLFSDGCKETYVNSSLDSSHKEIKSEKVSNFKLADNDDEEDDLDVFCSKCKTICPIGFVAHSKTKRLRSKRRNLTAMTPNEWNQLSAEGVIDIYCLEDYLSYVTEIDEQEESEDDSENQTSNDHFQNDILFYFREDDEIRKLIIQVERALEKRLR